jgi:hypothetical protein
MTRLLVSAAILMSTAALTAGAQVGPGSPDPAVVAAMEHVKDQCTTQTPCKYKVERRGPQALVTIEFTRKETPSSEPRPYPGGRARLTIDSQGNLVKRVDGE